MAAVCAASSPPRVGTRSCYGRHHLVPARSARAVTKAWHSGRDCPTVTTRVRSLAHASKSLARHPSLRIGTPCVPRRSPGGNTPNGGFGGRSSRHTTNAVTTNAVDVPTPRQEKQVVAVLCQWALQICVGIFALDLILRAVSAGMRSAGLTTAPLVTALILLTTVLLVVPEKSTPGRLIKETLQPAVKFVDAQIACIFIPYITAVPVSNLPPANHLSTACLVCVLGTLATMFVAGKIAQLVGKESVLGEGQEMGDGDGVGGVIDTPEEFTKPIQMTAAVAAARVCGDTPLEILWAAATALLIPLCLIPWMTLSFSVTAAPAYIAATAGVYVLMRKIPQRVQKLGFFPTVTGGVAMAAIAAAVGTATGVGPSTGITQYVQGAGAFYLYFVPPAVLGLAFRVKHEWVTLKKNGVAIVLSVLIAVPGCMLLSAYLGSGLNLPVDITLASLPKCTTTGLAVHMAHNLGVDQSLAAAGCALSATIGLSAGRAILDGFRITGQVARGCATGASSHAAGTAALAAAGEEKAAAVSGVVFALSGVLGVLLLESGKFRALLFAAAGGAV